MSRDAYVEKLKAKLDEWNAEIDRLQAKSKNAEADARIEYEQKVGELRRLRDDARERLDHLKGAGSDAWDEMRSGFQEFWDHATRAFERTAAGLR